MPRRLRSRHVICMTGSCPISYKTRDKDNELARMTAAVLSVTLTPLTRPTSFFALSRIEEIFVPLGGLYSIVTANSPRSRISFKRRGPVLMNSVLVLRSSGRALRRLQCIIQQHRNRHWSDAAGDGRDPAGLLADRAKINIADERPVVQTIHADIDYDGAVSYHIGRHKFGFADRHDQNVCLPADGR